jgi:hypothetical protein
MAETWSDLGRVHQGRCDGAGARVGWGRARFILIRTGGCAGCAGAGAVAGVSGDRHGERLGPAGG